MKPERLADLCRTAEQGRPDVAAQAAIGECDDQDAEVLEAVMRYSVLPDAELVDFEERAGSCWLVRVPRVGGVWLAPLSAWGPVPARAGGGGAPGGQGLGAAAGGGRCWLVRVPRVGEFWLAPLSAWSQLPAGAVVVSPRGLKALGTALVRALGVREEAGR